MMRLTIHKSEWLDNWYIIERAEHDGREWIESETAPNGTVHGSLRCSSRFSDADVEGNAHEMLAIADAIVHRGEAGFRRCSVRIDGDRVFFCSPRNSSEDGECTLAEADELAKEIHTALLAEPVVKEATDG